jgi:hypothetical protein
MMRPVSWQASEFNKKLGGKSLRSNNIPAAEFHLALGE